MDNSTLAAFIGGATGALLTYLLMRVGDISTKIYERQQKHFNALVQLEYLCCENLHHISQNISIIDDFIATVEEPLKNNTPVIYGDKLHSIPFNESIVLNLCAIDFMNEVLNYKIDIVRINHDINTIGTMYETFKTAFISKTIDFQTYQGNALIAIQKCRELKPFLEQLDDKTIYINAYTRLLAKEDKPLLSRIILYFSKRKSLTKKLVPKLAEEIDKIKKDREDVMIESAKEIKKALDRYKSS